jgi:Prealbumin-like fold domain
MSLGSIRRRPVRRRWVFGITTAVLAAVTVFIVASASGIVPGSPSNFESGDGNMIVDTSGNHDWSNVTFVHATDLFKDGADDSFDTGGKQDTTCPDVIGHQNPPKDDFTDVAFFFEQTATSDPYLYGATIRYAPNGTAAEVVEFNKGTAGACPNAPSLLQRVAGDKLLAIDYTQGGASVVFNVLTWVTSGACFVGSHSAPCWGASVLTVAAAGGEGAASTADISAANNPISNADIKAGQFAEFGINLKVAQIFGTQGCTSFASTTWGSRSSGSSFVASTKDITVLHRTISNCATVIIRKVTTDSNTSVLFNYSANIVRLDPAGTVTSFGLHGGENNTITGVKPGQYFTTEADPGPAYKLDSISCAASDLSHGSTIDSTTNPTASFTVKADDTIDCTFTNSPVKGAFIILKKSQKTGNNVLKAGAEFCFAASNDCSTTNVVDNGTGDNDQTIGKLCVSDVPTGTYKVNETKAPPGYGSASESNVSVTVSGGTNCTDNLPSASVTFTDPPLADIQVNFRDGGSGETSLDVPLACTGDTSGTSDSTTVEPGWQKSLTITGVKVTSSSKPAITFTCTIKIDP